MRNNFKFAIGLCVATLFSTIVVAAQVGPKKELLSDIKAETKKCAVQIIGFSNGTNQVAGYRSTCPTLKIISMSQAQIFIDGQWFQAKIVESIQSDGGDLDDLYIADAKGQVVARKVNIAAYDSVIVAMAGTSDLRTK